MENKDSNMAGYNIPISVSASQSFSVPQTTNAPTYFVFSSEGARVGGDIRDSGADSYAPATATSAAAQRDASAITGEQGGFSKGGGFSMTTAVVIGAVAVGLALIAAVYIYKKR